MREEVLLCSSSIHNYILCLDDIVVQWIRGWLANHKALRPSLNCGRNVEVAYSEDAHLPNSPVNKFLLFSSCKY